MRVGRKNLAFVLKKGKFKASRMYTWLSLEQHFFLLQVVMVPFNC